MNISKFLSTTILAVGLLAPVALVAQDLDVSDVRQSVQDGQYNQARAQLSGLSENPIDRIFLEVDIAVAQGRTDEAIELLRQLVAIAPEFLPARQRLAELLVGDQRFSSARFHYQELKKIDANDRNIQFYDKRIADIDGLDKFSYGFGLTIIPSNNINNASVADEQCIIALNNFCGAIPDELQAQKGLKVVPTVSATYRYHFADNQQFILNLSARAEKYSVETLDNYSLTIAPKWQYARGGLGLEAGLFYTRRIGDGEVYATQSDAQTGESTAVIRSADERSKQYGFNLGVSRKLTDKMTGRLGYTRTYAKYDDEKNYGFLDSVSNSVDASLNYRINPRNEANFGINWRNYDENMDGPDEWHRDYEGISVRTGLRTAWESGFVTDIGLRYGKRDYDGLGPYSTEIRKDTSTSLNFSVQNNNWTIGKFTPRLNCALNNDDSNIENYRYDTSLNCGLSLTTEF